MSAWLARIGASVLQFFLEKLVEYVGGLFRRKKRHDEIDKEAKESKKPLDEAKDEKATDEAAKDILGGL